MNVFKTFFYAIVFFMFSNTNTYAATDLGIIICNGCNSAQYENKAYHAVRATLSRQGEFTVTVMDIVNEKLTLYYLVHSYGPGVPEFSVVLSTPSPDTLSDFQEAMITKNQILNELSSTTIPEEIAPNAHSIVINSYYRHAVADWTWDNHTTWDAVMSYFSLPIFIISNLSPADLNLIIDVSFTDGSTARFKINGITQNGIEYKYMDGTAKDSSGNLIPNNQFEFTERSFHFIDDISYDNFLQHASFYGVPIIDNAIRGIPTSCSPNNMGGLVCLPL